MRKGMAAFCLIVLTAVILGANMYRQTMYFMDMDRVVDSVVIDGGEAYDICDNSGNYVYLRRISPDGVLMSKTRMPETSGSMFFKRQIIGVDSGFVYLYEWDYNALNYIGVDEYVLRCDTDKGTVEKLYQTNAPKMSRASQGITDGAVYLACVSGDAYMLRKIYLSNGDVEDIGLFVPPRDMNAFGVDGNLNIVITTPDSRSWISDNGTDWLSYVAAEEYKTQSYAVSSVPFLLLWNVSLLPLLAVELAAAWAVCILILHVTNRRRTPLLIKQLLIFTPMFAAGLIALFYVFDRSLDDTIAAQVHERLIINAAEKAELIDAEQFAAIDWSDPFGSEYYCSLRKDFQRYSEGVTREWSVPPTNAYSYTSYWLYYVKDGRALVAACDDRIIGEPMRHLAEIEWMLETGVPTFHNGFDSLGEGDWLNVFYPIWHSGVIVGFVEASEPLIQSTYEFSGFKLNTAFIGMAMVVSEILALLAVLGLTLRALKKLKLGALAVTGGDYGYKVNIRTRDELSDIAAAFNQMSKTVESSIADISKTSEAYSRFVPSEMFSLLGKNDVLSVNPGDGASVHTTLMRVRIHKFSEYNRRNGLFEFLNEFFSRSAPFIERNGGIVERYSEYGLTAVFEGGPECALRAAESIFWETLDMGCSAAICREPALIGVIGVGGRMSVNVVSHHLQRLDNLCRLGERLGCHAIITQSAYEVATGGVTNGSRFLGYMNSGDGQTAIYDVFRRADPEVRERKHETLELFKNAVDLYYANDFYAARNGFIEVIKRSPSDLAAREYLLLSDGLYLSGAKTAKPLLDV